MNYDNKIQRLSSTLELLSSGYKLSTPELVKRYGVTKKIIQTDFKEYILPLFSDDTIYYDYSIKCYVASHNFLQKTLLNSHELSVIAILKNKSKDKYSDKDLSQKVDMLFEKFEEELSNKVYQKSSVEKIDSFKNEIILIKNAITSKRIIRCIYNDKIREVYPLEILNLEGYWYLVIYNPNEDKIKTFHLNSVKNIEILEDEYGFDESVIKRFENAISAYYKPQNPTIIVELFIDKQISKYFHRKPLNPTQRVIKKYEDDSIDIEIEITDFMEIVPTIQRYMPFIGVISPKEIKDMIDKNIQDYLKI